MRKAPNVKAERFRVSGPVNTNCGFFNIPQDNRLSLNVMAGDGFGWDHVSVSKPSLMPDYEEMRMVKNLFFRDDECVMELHVPASEHINNHAYCLHLWRPQTAEEIASIRREWESAGEECPWGVESPGVIPRPPAILVGVKGVVLK